jgi:ABC-type microcin C transport system permease subunit YejB
MFKFKTYLPYMKYSAAAAIMYCIPVLIFIIRASYTDAWLLYVGNALFLTVIVFFMISFNKARKENASSMSMLITGHVVTVAGIIMACLLSLLIMTIFVPGLFESGTPGRVLTDEPAQMTTDKTDGLNFMILMSAIVGNVSMGSFASIIFAFTPQRDQTKESTRREEQVI